MNITDFELFTMYMALRWNPSSLENCLFQVFAITYDFGIIYGALYSSIMIMFLIIIMKIA
jgi:hypothetical protein